MILSIWFMVEVPAKRGLPVKEKREERQTEGIDGSRVGESEQMNEGMVNICQARLDRKVAVGERWSCMSEMVLHERRSCMRDDLA